MNLNNIFYDDLYMEDNENWADMFIVGVLEKELKKSIKILINKNLSWLFKLKVIVHSRKIYKKKNYEHKEILNFITASWMQRKKVYLIMWPYKEKGGLPFSVSIQCQKPEANYT